MLTVYPSSNTELACFVINCHRGGVTRYIRFIQSPQKRFLTRLLSSHDLFHHQCHSQYSSRPMNPLDQGDPNLLLEVIKAIAVNTSYELGK